MKALLPLSLALAAISTPSVAQKETMTTEIKPPVAEKRPHQSTHHGITLTDDYYWLKDQGYPKVDDADVLSYLNAENAYFEAQMAPLKPLVEEIFQEMKGRIKEDDSTVPQKDGAYIYWSKFDEGQQYRKHYRKAAAGGPDELILDENELAEGKEYFRLGATAITDDDRILAYSTDTDGSERFTVRFRDLSSGTRLPDTVCGARGKWGEDSVEGTLGNIVFSKDGCSLLYGAVNDKWRVDRIKLHKIGTLQTEDAIVYAEPDEGFQVGVGLTVQEDWIVIATGDNATSEVRLVPANDPAATPIMVSPRQVKREYSVDVRDGQLFILTNDDHVNFRIATASLEKPGEWKTLIAGSDQHYLTGIDLFKNFYVTEGRIDGLDQVEIRDYSDSTKVQTIPFPEASYDAGLGDNPEYDVSKLRLGYESMVTPDTVFDYDVATKKFTTLKVQEIPSGYDAAGYVTERLMVKARDGAMVPVSVVYKKGFKKDGSQPLHLYAYGAYGYATPPGFSTTRLSLLDRGFAYAIAHIRGGDDLGYQWYLDGKLEKRTNTFNDFVDVGRALIEQGYTAKGRLTASGGSAGGELMGAVANQAPELFGAIVAHVPFVDVLNTMLDDTLPLTPGEWPEWGNPIKDRAAFDLLRSYSPYDNVEAKAYPPMLYTGGLNDPRVTYWEPAKMVAKLRAMKTDNNHLLMKINMGAGHGGKSGRFERLRENAEEAAFLLWQLGMVE